MTNKDSSFIDEIRVNEENNIQILIYKLKKHIISAEDLTESQRIEVKRILEKEISVKKEIVKDKNNKLFIKRIKKAEKREEVFDIMSEEDKKNVLEYLKSIDKK